MLKVADLRKKSEKDLQKELTKLRDEIATTQKEKFTTEDKNVKKIRNLRKDVARVMTVLNEETDQADDKSDAKKEDN